MVKDAMADASGMDEGGPGRLKSFLQSKARSPRPEPLPSLPSPPAHTPARAAAIAIGRAADRLYHLGVRVADIRSLALTLSEMPEFLPELSLLSVLQGPQDRTGVMALCPETVTALIEMQTMGQVTDRPVGRRKPTRSDAMLCADFINQFLQELAIELQPIEGFDTVAGYRYASFLDEVGPLGLMLEDQPYRSFGIDVVWGGHLRPARIFLALPQSSVGDGHRRKPDAMTTPFADQGLVSPPLAPQRNAPERPCSDISAVQIDVIGVLARRRMSLRDIRALVAGKSIALPLSALAEARIETAGGQLLATGKMGEMQGCHAIRLRPAGATLNCDENMTEQAFAMPGQPAAWPDLSEPDDFRPEREHPEIIADSHIKAVG